MSGTYNYDKVSRRSNRRNRHKQPYKPSSSGKPSRLRSAGTRVTSK